MIKPNKAQQRPTKAKEDQLKLAKTNKVKQTTHKKANKG